MVRTRSRPGELEPLERKRRRCGESELGCRKSQKSKEESRGRGGRKGGGGPQSSQITPNRQNIKRKITWTCTERRLGRARAAALGGGGRGTAVCELQLLADREVRAWSETARSRTPGGRWAPREAEGRSKEVYKYMQISSRSGAGASDPSKRYTDCAAWLRVAVRDCTRAAHDIRSAFRQP